MYGTHRLLSAIVGISALFASSSAMAVFEPNGLYAIGGIGWSWAEDTKLKSVVVDGNQLNPVVDTKQEFMFRFGLGTLLTDMFGVEFRYNYFNKFSTRVGLGDAFGDTLRLEASPEYFDLVGLIRFEGSPQFSGFVTVGPGYGRISRAYDSTNASDYLVLVNGDAKDSVGWGVAASVGVQYEFTPLWGLRLEAAGIKGRDSIKIGTISGNVVMNIL